MLHIEMRALSLAAIVLSFGLSQARAADVGAKAVLELFTSQGCSSCPPADRMIGELAHREGMIVLTLPVDYWDYLGWKDTLAKPAFGARQAAYARCRGDHGIYTPQVVVNGVTAVVGSNAEAIERAISGTGERPDVLATKVSLEDRNGEITVAISGDPGSAGTVVLAAVARQRTVAIRRGENAHERITYTNVVRKLTSLSHWTGIASRFRISRAKAVPPDADAVIALVQADQNGLPGAVMGVAEEH